MPAGLAVCLLGVVEARRSSTPLPINGRKLQASLALLALSVPGTVSDDRLVDEVWPDDTLANPTNSLQAQISQLRRLLGRDVVVRHGSGYALDIEPDDVDGLLFERLVERSRRLADEGDHRNAAQGFQSALSLIRGPPLSELIDYSFAREAGLRFDELRLAAHEGLADADLACGRHAEQVAALSELVLRHPLRERFHAQLILALYRCGRQADALQAYRSARRTLIEELGVEPGRELRELELAVLSHDPVLDAPAVPVVARRSDRAPTSSPRERVGAGLGIPMVGRDDELDRLAADLDDVVAGHGRVVLLGGEPGIGKSRLAEEVATMARSRGAVVALGRCHSGRGAPTMWPWTQTVQSLLAAAEPEVAAAALGRGAAEIARLVPEVRDLVPDVAESPAVDPDADRFRLFQALTGFFRRVGDGRPVVLLLDDLHWADAAALQMLSFLAASILEAPLLVVGTYRSVGGPASGPLAETFADLARQPLVRNVEVAGLDRGAVGDMIRAVGTAVDEEVVDAVHRRTQGNPFFVIETLRLHPGPDELRDPVTIPMGIRDVVRQRVSALPGPTIEVMSAASVLGTEFDVRLLASMLDMAPVDALHRLDPAVTSRLVGSDGTITGRYRFSHGLVRDTLYEGLGIGVRAGLHERAGAALEAVGEQPDGPHLMALAEHWSLAVPATSPERAIEYSVRAARWAQRNLAHEQAEQHLRAALVLVHAMPPGRSRDALELTVQDELTLVLIVTKGYGAPGLDRACARMRDLCRTTEAPDLLAPALWRLGMVHMVGNDLDTAKEIGEQLLGDPDDPRRRVDGARTLAGHMMLGPVHTYRGELIVARQHFDVAADLCGTELVHRVEEFVPEHPAVWVACMSAWNWSLIGDDAHAEQEVRRALELARAVGDGRAYPVSLARWMSAVVASMRRDIDATRRRSEEAIAQITDTGHGTVFLTHLAANLAWTEAVGGADDDSRRARASAVAPALTVDASRSWQHGASGFLADALLANGLFEEALAAADAGLAGVDAAGARWHLAELHRLRGEALAASGKVPAAIDAFGSAIDTARAQGARGLEQRAATSLARWSPPAPQLDVDDRSR